MDFPECPDLEDLNFGGEEIDFVDSVAEELRELELAPLEDRVPPNFREAIRDVKGNQLLTDGILI